VKRQFRAQRPNQLWVSDFTYAATWSGFVYTAFVIDVHSRKIVGWRTAAAMTTPLVMDALNMAVFSRRLQLINRVIAHSGAGSQGGFNRSSQHLESEVSMMGRQPGWLVTQTGRPMSSKKVLPKGRRYAEQQKEQAERDHADQA